MQEITAKGKKQGDIAKEKALQGLYALIKSDGMLKNELLGKRFVPGEGCLNPRLLFIGEAPGKDEEEQGRPFVGAAGRNLGRLLEEIGISREDVFITNLVKFRPVSDAKRSKNRKPSKKEAKAWLPCLEKEMKIINPGIIVCLGASSAEALLGRKIEMRKDNSRVFEWRGLKLLVSYHPSPLNFNNPEKRKGLKEAFIGIKRLVKDCRS